MKKCSYCGKEYGDEATVCAIDRQSLVHLTAAPPRAAMIEPGGNRIGFAIPINSLELEITWSRAARVWWSYFWRNLIALVVAIVISMVLGFVIGSTLGTIGIPLRVIQLIGALVGFVIGLAISVVPIRMILGKDFGEFRLVLLAKQPPSASASSASEITQ